ncbi:uncharacterized protein [Dermacentor albipictus]|uniref:uncharacterized protein isoform X2 n=1 Tax=Dermacentor albipictus TaxID=60249 RepID=UPI0031FC798A
MRDVLQAAVLLSLVPWCLAPFPRERRPPFYDSDPLQDYFLPGGKVSFPNVLGGANLLRLNNTRELIGSWTVVSRYLVHVLAKDPVRAEFFSDFLQQRKVATFGNLLDQVRIHQPYIYQLFQVIVVFANIGLVCGTSIIVLRCMGTCGASRCQDVTINYRLLFHAYTASSWIVCGSVVFVAGFALTCDYSLDSGMKELDKYVHEYKDRIRSFLDEKMVQAAKTTFDRMSMQLERFRRLFSKVFGGLASRAIAFKVREELDAPSIFGENVYNNTFEFLISGINDNFTNLRRKMATIELKTKETSSSIMEAVMFSTLFQRHAIVITVADLMQQLRGQLFAFSYEVRHVEEGVKSMTTILLSNKTSQEKNLLDLAGVKNIVTYSIVAVMIFVVITMGGMMTGFTLGFANHYGHASPLERNKLSNVAGYILVLTSHIMVFGSSLMLLSSGLFMLMGCIGDIYLCRSQRSYYHGVAEPLKDLTISLLMNATESRHFVMKLLKYSLVEKHCRENVGIGALAGIKPRDLEAALDKIVEFQTDLVHHYKIDIRGLVQQLTNRWNIVKEFWDLFNKTDLLAMFKNDEKLYEYITGNRSHFENLVKQTFLDFTIENCDDLKNNISFYIDEFGNIGVCSTIVDIFSDGFNIICNRMIDFVNGYWLSLIILVGIYVYGIYISLTASKYLYTMESYTYEGEPVRPDTKFEDLQIHKRQRARKKGIVAPIILNEDERLRSEDAERLRQIRLRKAMMAPDTQLKYLVPLSPTVKTTATAKTT